MSAVVQAFDQAWRSGLAPDPAISVGEWANAYRMLPASAAEPGRWRTSRTPYLADIMDALSPASPVERVVIMKSAQVGGSEAGLNFIGAIIHLWPGLTLHVSPTSESARRFVRSRLDPMLEATPELSSRIVTPGPRKSGNSTFLKSYPGGMLAMVGANSGVGLRATPARFVILDEIDGFPRDAGGEGDPVQLAVARTATFRGRRKILLISTPTIEGASRIASAYAETDQRKLFCPCLSCDESFTPQWEHVSWPEGKPGKAHLDCPVCGGIHEERDKAKLLAGGHWRATSPGDGRSAGFHITGVISPFVSWAELARDFIAAKADTSRMQVFVNTGLGLTYEDTETAPLAVDVLLARATECEIPWADLLPDGAAIITCGADVQQDRIECEFVAWGAGERSWSIAYDICWGDTSQDAVWTALDVLIARRFRHPRAVPDLAVSAVAIDAGFRTDRVMGFAQSRASRRVWAVKGRAGPGIKPWPSRPPKPRRGGVVPVHIVGVDPLKMTLMQRLRITDAAPGYCAFPSDRDRSWFMQVTSERLIRKYQAGRLRLEWLSDRQIRNEALDCRIYATAALHGLYALGLALDVGVEKLTAAPLRTTPNNQTMEQRPVARTIRSRWLEG